MPFPPIIRAALRLILLPFKLIRRPASLRLSHQVLVILAVLTTLDIAVHQIWHPHIVPPPSAKSSLAHASSYLVDTAEGDSTESALLDSPFTTTCRDPRVERERYPRENATFVMLARNQDLDDVLMTVRNIEEKFNRWFEYPYVFLNDEEFDAEFRDRVMALLDEFGGRSSKAERGREDREKSRARVVKFEKLKGSGVEQTTAWPQHGLSAAPPPQSANIADEWGFPAWMGDDERLKMKAAIKKQTTWRGSQESYHHMCRFYSGKFYTLPVLADYKWYWRIEPGVEYTCAITYDPFAAMARHGKVYGYVIALWEIGDTCPGLFRAVEDYRVAHNLPATPMWKAMIDPSWLPTPLRWIAGWLRAPHRTADGDVWNMCHYWSNFEIADLDFFRGEAYQDLYEHLDREGGFYRERWGDAPVHSLAVHLLLDATKTHHFADFGYLHTPFYQCPGNAPGQQLLFPDIDQVLGYSSPSVSSLSKGNLPGPKQDLSDTKKKQLTPEVAGGVGCYCECDGARRRKHPGLCLAALQKPLTPSEHRPRWWQRLWGWWPYSAGLSESGFM